MRGRFLAVSLVALLSVSDGSYGTSWNVVAKTGDIVPGTFGEAVYQQFGLPVVTEARDVVFPASISGATINSTNGDVYIRAPENGNLSLIARQGMSLELGRDTRLDETRLRGVMADGQIVLTGTVTGTTPAFRRAWTLSEVSVNELMRSQTLSGRGDGSRWHSFEGRVAESGFVVGRLQLDEGNNEHLNSGIWWSPDGASTGSMLIRQGDIVAGLDEPTRLGEVGHVAVNRWGEFTIAANLQRVEDTDPTSGLLENILSYRPGHGWSPVALKEDPVPDRPEDTFSEFSFPTINDAGFIGFTATESVDSTHSAWVVGPGGEFHRIATDGDFSRFQEGTLEIRVPAPANRPFVRVDNSGRAAFVGEVVSTDDSRRPYERHAVFQSDLGREPSIVARNGWEIPDRPSLRLGDPDLNSSSFDVTLTDSGIGILNTAVHPGAADGRGSGLFQFDRNGNLSTLIASGDEVALTPDDLRIIQTAWMMPDEQSSAATGVADDGPLAVLGAGRLQ